MHVNSVTISNQNNYQNSFKSLKIKGDKAIKKDFYEVLEGSDNLKTLLNKISNKFDLSIKFKKVIIDKIDIYNKVPVFDLKIFKQGKKIFKKPIFVGKGTYQMGDAIADILKEFLK